VGAAVFQQTEYTQQWSYLQSLYFSYTSLLTIGYGDPRPQSNSGKAFFVIWSQLAVPSLTILISNMGDTIVKAFADITVSIAAVTVLPDEQGFRAGFTTMTKRFFGWAQNTISDIEMPGIFGDIPRHPQSGKKPATFDGLMRDRLADRLSAHVTQDARVRDTDGDTLGDDIQFYHYVLARECRVVQCDLSASPPKRYSWEDWEYFLKLIGNEENPISSLGNHHGVQATTSMSDRGSSSSPTGDKTRNAQPANQNYGTEAKVTSAGSTGQPGHTSQQRGVDDNDGAIQSEEDPSHHSRSDRNHQTHHSHTEEFLRSWSWLSKDSPLMSSKSEAEWILDRLSAALERELERQQRGHQQQPPIGLRDVRKKVEREAKKSTADSTKQDLGND
jgi:potassium channel subfamily K